MSGRVHHQDFSMIQVEDISEKKNQGVGTHTDCGKGFPTVSFDATEQQWEKQIQFENESEKPPWSV